MRPCATVPAAPLAVACRPGFAAGPHLARYYPAIHPPQRPDRPEDDAVPTSDPPPPRPGRDPGGRIAYLPPRAARARKLILRSQLGRGWIVASALFGVVILAAGVLFLARAGQPGPPWVRVAALPALPAGAVTEAAGPSGQVVVVDRRDGLRAFLAPPGPCPVRAAGAGFARPCTGQHWDAAGAPAAGPRASPAAPPPLRRVPATLAGGALYVDPR
jgi:hypothetical protein